jgi:hypothetical protein
MATSPSALHSLTYTHCHQAGVPAGQPSCISCPTQPAGRHGQCPPLQPNTTPLATATPLLRMPNVQEVTQQGALPLVSPATRPKQSCKQRCPRLCIPAGAPTGDHISAPGLVMQGGERLELLLQHHRHRVSVDHSCTHTAGFQMPTDSSWRLKEPVALPHPHRNRVPAVCASPPALLLLALLLPLINAQWVTRNTMQLPCSRQVKRDTQQSNCRC